MDTVAIEEPVRAIAALLARGLPQDAATLACLASTLGELPPDVLAARLDDPDDLEATPLRELVLFPNRNALCALEPTLDTAELDATGQMALGRALAGRVRHVDILFPERPAVTLHVTANDLDIFVNRLRPTATPPRELREALAARLAPDQAVALTVDCRHSGLTWTRPRRAFLLALLGRLAPDAADRPELFRYALRLLGELPPQTPPLAALPRRREQLDQQYHRARLQEQALATSNFETLLLTGTRLPHLYAPDLARDIARLDAILLALTGRTGASQAPRRRELGTVEDAAGLLRALGTLEE